MTNKLTVLGGFTALALVAACSSSPESGGGATLGPPTIAPGTGAPGASNAQTDPNQGGNGQQAQNDLQGTGGTASTEGTANVGGVAGGAMVGNDTGVGAAGASMEPAAGGEILTGEGLALVPNAEGWVAGGTNGVGIQGAFYSYSDADGGGATTMDPMEVDATTGTVCISGTASQIIDGNGDGDLDYSTYWGGGLGLALGDLGAMMGTQPWDRGDVTGFSFTLSGANIPPSMRFVVESADGTSGCVAMDLGATTAGAKTFSFAQVQQRCWNDPANPPAPLAAGGLTQIQWQVVSVDTAATPFDFCVENVTAVQ